MLRFENTPPIDLVGGVVAYNEERRLAAAVESLLAQELPSGVRWRTIWVVVSGCTDRTEEVAQRLSASHSEVRVVVQREREGKASALREVFRRALGDYLVLLNADARAQPGAVAALLRAARPLHTPYGVMGRPEPVELPTNGAGAGIAFQWNLHHRLHTELISAHEGSHLSDELLLLPATHLPPLPEGVVNDGAFIGGWLRSHEGELGYATEARAAIEVPWTLSDHIRQRRRIHVGHRQVEALVGVAPTTIARYFLRRPDRALALLSAEVRASSHGTAALAWLLAGELAASAAAFWDRLPPRRTHRLWTPIGEEAGSQGASGSKVGRTSSSAASSDRAG